MKKSGEITIPPGSEIWPHELETAKALAATGKAVEFLRRQDGYRVKNADAVMDGVLWEIKAPLTGELRRLERILRRASKQSPNIIIDTIRARLLCDVAVEKELMRLIKLNRSIRRLILVTKDRKVIDIR